MKKLLYLLAIALFTCLPANSQEEETQMQNTQKPCSQPQAGQFDFWVGNWDLEWKTPQGETQKGTNTITKILGGCVIQESFDGGEKVPLKGLSHSVYDAQAKIWKQTWVDNSGGYLDFTGDFKNGKMTLRRESADQKGKKVMQRMVFYNIEKNSLDWNWESSRDEGKTWNILWKIHYERNLKKQETKQISTVTGDLRLHEFASKIFNNTRKLRVLLPPDYDNNAEKSYPVLYMQDGQDLFDVATSIFSPMEWRVDETIKSLLEKELIEPFIVVGIDNAGKRDRPNEYLPWEDIYLTPPVPNPNGAKYPDFLTEEVMPFIEKRYRVKKGFENTGLGGSSYGGLITLYTIIKKPNVFGRVLIESPSFYVSEGQILKDVLSLKRLPDKVYIGVGTNEESQKNCTPGDHSHIAVRDVLKLEEILLDKKINKRSLKVFIEDCAIHNEDAYARRLPEALKFLYAKD